MGHSVILIPLRRESSDLIIQKKNRIPPGWDQETFIEWLYKSMPSRAILKIEIMILAGID